MIIIAYLFSFIWCLFCCFSINLECMRRGDLGTEKKKNESGLKDGEVAFNINKCPILQTGTRNLKSKYGMSSVKLESVKWVKDLGITIVSSLKFSQQWKDAKDEANRMVGFINRNFSFKN